MCKLYANRVQTLWKQIRTMHTQNANIMQTYTKHIANSCKTIGKLFVKDDAVRQFSSFPGALLHGGGKLVRVARSSCISLSRNLSPMLCQPPPSWAGFRLSLWAITAPSQLHLGIARRNSSSLGEVTRMGSIGRPGSGSKLYYINLWAMCWPTDHPKKPLTG